jgi:iron-sulfur cluster assembly protein
MSIQLTEKAANEVKRVMEEQDLKDNALRIGVVGGGCSGLNYQLEFIAKTEVDPLNDDCFEFHGIEAVVDRRCLPYLEGTVVDWHEDLNQRGFKFENPNAKGGCGCNKSFHC